MKTLIAVLLLSVVATPVWAAPNNADNMMTITLPQGDVKVELMPENAPKTVAQIKSLVASGFYDRLEWFRVIENFVAQTGYPKGTKGKSSLPDLPAEFTKYKFRRGTLGMGHGADINSANSQFFICLSDEKCAELTGKYTAFGQVVSGMEYADALPVGEPPARPAKTVKMTLDNGVKAPKAAKSFGNQ